MEILGISPLTIRMISADRLGAYVRPHDVAATFSYRKSQQFPHTGIISEKGWFVRVAERMVWENFPATG
jgi:hypothetical protein